MGYPLSSGFFSAKGSFLKNWGGRAILSCREYKDHVRKELIRTRREEEMTRFFTHQQHQTINSPWFARYDS